MAVSSCGDFFSVRYTIIHKKNITTLPLKPIDLKPEVCTFVASAVDLWYPHVRERISSPHRKHFDEPEELATRFGCCSRRTLLYMLHPASAVLASTLSAYFFSPLISFALQTIFLSLPTYSIHFSPLIGRAKTEGKGESEKVGGL
jgi:hypothetical protein